MVEFVGANPSHKYKPKTVRDKDATFVIQARFVAKTPKFIREPSGFVVLLVILFVFVAVRMWRNSLLSVHSWLLSLLTAFGPSVNRITPANSNG